MGAGYAEVKSKGGSTVYINNDLQTGHATITGGADITGGASITGDAVYIKGNTQVEIKASGSNPVVLGSPVYVGGKENGVYTGTIYGNGQHITNTVDIDAAMHEDKDVKKDIYNIGPTMSLYIDNGSDKTRGSHESGSFTIPHITFDNKTKRPTFVSVQTIS